MTLPVFYERHDQVRRKVEQSFKDGLKTAIYPLLSLIDSDRPHNAGCYCTAQVVDRGCVRLLLIQLRRPA